MRLKRSRIIVNNRIHVENVDRKNSVILPHEHLILEYQIFGTNQAPNCFH